MNAINEAPKPKGKPLSRSEFLGKTAIAAAVFTIVPRHVLGGPGYFAPSDTLNMAMIGVGGQGTYDMKQFLQTEGVRMISLADPNTEMDYSKTYFGGVAGRKPAQQIVNDHYAKDKKSGRYKGCTAYVDFNEMLDKEKDIDAVGTCTTDNVHAVATMAAIKLGKHVYTQKPLAHDIYEARMLAEAARKYGVASQMGNQGHAGEGIRLISEWIADGAIGDVSEVHCWTNRPIRNWPQGVDRPTGKARVPRGLDWDKWIGPAPMRPFNPAYLPFVWRGWWDFGTGVMGDMGCHVMDIPVEALKLGHPSSIVASSTPVNDETAPLACLVNYEFPARNGMPPVTMTWYDGGLQPPRPPELEEGRRIPTSGTIFVGSKGKIMCNDVGANARIIPETKMKAYTLPPKTIPRVPGIHQNFVDAARGGEPATSNFDVAGPLTEIVLLTNLAIRAGRNVRLEWDGPNMKVTNVADANKYVQREYREGWSL